LVDDFVDTVESASVVYGVDDNNDEDVKRLRDNILILLLQVFLCVGMPQ